MRQRTLIALAILAAAAGFLVLAAAYDSDWLVDLDVEVAGWMRDAPGWLTDAARVLGAFGGYIVLPLAVVVAVVLSLRADRVDDALFVVIVALGADILVHGGRELHEPTRIDAQGLPDESRFPAGDATTSVAIWGALALLASRGRSRGRRIGIVATGLALGLVVAATRVVLDEQALSDVLAGGAPRRSLASRLRTRVGGSR